MQLDAQPDDAKSGGRSNACRQHTTAHSFQRQSQPGVSRCLSREVPTSLELGRRLLEEKHVAVVPGEGFGAPGYFRLSFARPMEELREGVRRIAEFLGERRGLGGS